MSPTREDIIWAAGLYEGEGSVGSAKHRSGTPRLPVAQIAEALGPW